MRGWIKNLTPAVAVLGGFFVQTTSARAAPPFSVHTVAAQDAEEAEVDRLNAAQIGTAYKGPVYYPGQPVPPAHPVQLQNQGEAASVVSAPAQSPAAAPKPVGGGNSYHGALYYPSQAYPALPSAR
ncbi:hypothetical protein AA0472_1184 [Acetobacter estunensis NRIC 0472]|nr:hypothetical protein [Acetobacter estunensis]GBQ23693.1 hypothetical protein AA0472_1184 [Acetobacter estunensis NRIC 0472]